ncbi:MAG: AAA family ATPase [Candidatus Eisenbacteria bacterium]
MNERQQPAKIILINGASSAGKSTLARALQQELPEPFLHLSFDHLRTSDALPMARIRNGTVDWERMRPAVFDGFHRSLAAFAEAGNNLIVDHIIESERWRTDLVELLTPFDVFCVGVHCPLPELERRERSRGDRRIGGL